MPVVPPSTRIPLEASDLLVGLRLERYLGMLVLRSESSWQTLSTALTTGGRRHARSLLLYRGDFDERPQRVLRLASQALGLSPPTVGLISPVAMPSVKMSTGRADGTEIRTLIGVARRDGAGPGAKHRFGPVSLVVVVDGKLSDAGAVELVQVAGAAQAAAFAEAEVKPETHAGDSDSAVDNVAVMWRRVGRLEYQHAGAHTPIGSEVDRMIRAAVLAATDGEPAD